MTARAVARTADRFRFGTLDGSADRPRKEWQHFILHSGPAHIIVNFSLTETIERGERREAARTIVLVHDGHRWTGCIDEHSPEAVEVLDGRLGARFGRSELQVREERYDLDLMLPSSAVSGRLVLTPQTEAVLMSNRQLGRSGRFSWLFVPRLTVDGWLMVDDRRFSFRRDPAYHDHNWGHFEWGGDFGWEWISMLGDDDATAAVVWRVTDRAHHASFGQGAMAWRDGTVVASFRDDEVCFEPRGFHRRAPEATVPVELSVLNDGVASDVPGHLRCSARNRRGDAMELAIDPVSTARILVPSECSSRRVATLHEVRSRMRLAGTVDGVDLVAEGSGVVELVR